MPKAKCDLIVVQPNPKSVLEPMMYYDPELQNAMNEDAHNPTRLQRALAKSKQLRADYFEQLTKLQSRLNKNTYLRFAAERDPLFDSNLLEFTFGDRLGFLEKQRRGLRVSARATFLSFEKDILHELHYRQVETLRVNVPEERWYDMGGDKVIDCLLSHELTMAGPSLMQHKFLFVSGTAISIAFAEVNWHARCVTQRASKRRLAKNPVSTHHP